MMKKEKNYGIKILQAVWQVYVERKNKITLEKSLKGVPTTVGVKRLINDPENSQPKQVR